MSINNEKLLEIKKNISLLRPNASLCIVTKKRSTEDILKLVDDNNFYFAENRIQEAEQKYVEIRKKYNFSLDLIGPLQTNKVKKALVLFDCIQTIDRKKLVDAIYEEIQKNENIKTKEFFIQVNIGKENQKNGILQDDLESLYDYALKKNLNITGLMCIPPNVKNPSQYFSKMTNLRDTLRSNLKLSMGMSNDYEHALKYKSDIIRIGSLIFN